MCTFFFCYHIVMNYVKWYNKFTMPMRANKVFVKLLQLWGEILTAIMYVIYPVLLLYILMCKKELLLKTILIPGISFLLLSYIRTLINRKRPYEQPEFMALLHKNTKGRSMPSRHVFSSMIITMAVYQISSFWGNVFLVITILNAVSRVIGGIHYPTDVIAGILSGALAGLFFFVI